MNLTHKYADAFPDITYPGRQTTDGETPMKIKTVAAPAGTVIYLRVTDPPDESPYGRPHDKDDNLDGGAGTIDGVRMTTVTLPANGSVAFVLRTTLNAAGDNYEVAASANPPLHTQSFVCDGSIHCQKTTVTTYKRGFADLQSLASNGVGMPRYDEMTVEQMIFAGAKWFGARRSAKVPSNTGLAVAASRKVPLTVLNNRAALRRGPTSQTRRMSTLKASSPKL